MNKTIDEQLSSILDEHHFKECRSEVLFQIKEAILTDLLALEVLQEKEKNPEHSILNPFRRLEEDERIILNSKIREIKQALSVYFGKGEE